MAYMIEVIINIFIIILSLNAWMIIGILVCTFIDEEIEHITHALAVYFFWPLAIVTRGIDKLTKLVGEA